MSVERLAVEIRDVFESGHVSNPGLESRVIAAIPWEDERKPRPLRRLRQIAVVAAVLAVVAVAALAASYGVAANTSRPSQEISQQEAIADAKKQLPNGGEGFRFLVAQLEPSSKHFEFLGPDGQGFSEDQGQECLVIPPIPRLPFTPCRYYPVWVVAFSSQTCDVVVGINAYSGRFAGGGAGSNGPSLDECQVVPESPDVTWFVPTWG